MILSVKSEGLCDLLLNVYKVLYFLLDRSPKTGFCDLVQFYLSWRASRYPCIFLEESALVSLGSPLQLVFFKLFPSPVISYSRVTAVLALALCLAFPSLQSSPPTYQNLKMMPVATRTMMMDMVIVT